MIFRFLVYKIRKTDLLFFEIERGVFMKVGRLGVCFWISLELRREV